MKSIFPFIIRWVSAGFLFALGVACAIVLLSFLPGAQPFENWFFPLSGIVTQTNIGNQPFPDSGQMQPMIASPLPAGPRPGGDLPTISIWMTFSEDPEAEKVTRVSRDRIEELQVWAESDKEGSASFTIWLISPMGTNQWGPTFQTSADQSPFSVGQFGSESGMQLGPYRLEARVGEMVVGGVEFELIE
jgi:hypothetical protein